MYKSLDAITDTVHNTKHPYHPVADRPRKPQKHRYERRKAKQYLQIGEWAETSET